MKDWATIDAPTSSLVCGICRCPPGMHREPVYSPPPAKPVPGTDYDIERVETVGDHLVMKVSYKCTYEGQKTMVFLNTTTLDALQWKKIDPHFRGHPLTPTKREAPPPAARFPSTDEGWADARAYAQSKVKR